MVFQVDKLITMEQAVAAEHGRRSWRTKTRCRSCGGEWTHYRVAPGDGMIQEWLCAPCTHGAPFATWWPVTPRLRELIEIVHAGGKVMQPRSAPASRTASVGDPGRGEAGEPTDAKAANEVAIRRARALGRLLGWRIVSLTLVGSGDRPPIAAVADISKAGEIGRPRRRATPEEEEIWEFVVRYLQVDTVERNERLRSRK